MKIETECIIDTTPIRGRRIYCPLEAGGCGAFIGVYFPELGSMLIGNLVLSTVHGKCACGKEFNFARSERHLENLLEARERLNSLVEL